MRTVTSREKISIRTLVGSHASTTTSTSSSSSHRTSSSLLTSSILVVGYFYFSNYLQLYHSSFYYTCTIKRKMNDHSSPSRIVGWIQSCGNLMPPPISNYIEFNLDTSSKVLNHVLFLLALSNIFLMMNSMKITIVTFFASCLLTFQTAAVILVMNHSKLSFAPRSLEPTEFILGFCLGLCVGGVVLSFFLSVTFRRAFSFCKVC